MGEENQRPGARTAVNNRSLVRWSKNLKCYETHPTSTCHLQKRRLKHHHHPHLHWGGSKHASRGGEPLTAKEQERRIDIKFSYSTESRPCQGIKLGMYIGNKLQGPEKHLQLVTPIQNDQRKRYWEIKKSKKDKVNDRDFVKAGKRGKKHWARFCSLSDRPIN